MYGVFVLVEDKVTFFVRRNIRLVLEYDGTNYHGWQYQENGVTIQQKLEEAIYKVTGEKLHVTGASRTDAGVHARGQTVNFRTASKVSVSQFPHALNYHLPNDIAVVGAERVPMNFSSTTDAKGKLYKYYIFNSYIRSPLKSKYCWQVRGQLDLDIMRQAAFLIQGFHDFKQFCAEKERYETTFRFVGHCGITEDEESVLVVEIFASSFLYNMVRRIVGTLINVGQKKYSLRKLVSALNDGDVKSGPTAPANGLVLWRVYY